MVSTYVIETEDRAKSLASFLLKHGKYSPIAVDTETEGCDPSKESPIGTARVWCLSLAWYRGGGGLGQAQQPNAAFIPRQLLPYFESVLSDPTVGIVGTKLWGYDRHALKNHGIELRGILGDTLDMSRLLNPSKLSGHGLKAWGEKLGYEIIKLDKILEIPWHDENVFTYKSTRTVRSKLHGHRVFYYEGATVQKISFSQTMRLTPQKLWDHYPWRREALVEYAVQDARMSLDTYLHLKEQIDLLGIDQCTRLFQRRDGGPEDVCTAPQNIRRNSF